MRDVLITLMVFGTLPFILRNPWYGVLSWSWLSYMSPHRLAWGFAYDMPFAQIVAVVLLASLLLKQEKRTLPSNPLMILWAVFLVWLWICTMVALEPIGAMDMFIKILKIQAITFVTILLMKDFEKVNQLIWVIVFSVGFYSVKGGVFTLVSGGGFHVFGPDGSDIMENNALAVATLMIVPLMMYLNKFPPRPWVKKIMPFCIFFSLVSVLGSQSRGALLAIISVGVFFWWKSGSKVVTATIMVLLSIFAFMFMPQSWHDRMASTADYQNDSSSMQRLDAWQYSYNVANARLTGGGLNSFTEENFARYGVKGEGYVAHSIYFSVLNDAGWPGFITFMAILLLMWWQLGRVIRVTQDNPNYSDYNFLARMLQISMLAFLSGGAFLSLSYFDLAWHLMAITIAMTQLTHGVSESKDAGKKVPKRPIRSGARIGAGMSGNIR